MITHPSSSEDRPACPSVTRQSSVARSSTWSPPAAASPTQVAADLDISELTIYVWQCQRLIDTGQPPGMTSTDHAELVAARRRFAELEVEVEIRRRAAELLKEVVAPKDATGDRGDGLVRLPVQLACRVLGVAESGYYEWRG